LHLKLVQDLNQERKLTVLDIEVYAVAQEMMKLTTSARPWGEGLRF
jgi:hypothetical protein